MLVSNLLKSQSVDHLSVNVYSSEFELALGAAQIVREYLMNILDQQTEARILLATGNTQIQFLDALIALGGVDWSRLVLFHLDEYLGIKAENTASFCYYLRERVEKKVKPKQFHYIKGDATEPLTECDRYANLLKTQPIDLCFLGIGQNGHIAFNEPSVANFNDPHWVKLVKLEESTQQIQVKQGYFPNLDAVPQYAYTVTIPTILSSKKIICLASGINKAGIVKTALEEEITVSYPVSILRRHQNAHLFLDAHSASLLQNR
ncbi:glucosamine-6-phosphate deaminase [Aphanothece hegewaldii CCALA 016]|uniref:Glucosamine-6-phosphate deaminase n=1 Tax=Aphanothece hegewaldii CCALA 016 TaxID=2107694 RepID=A0A2T1LTU2_9CHRO|nr:glucosamine-6-phosphate deaminase [Aphanothece hegewaldii]PSF34537.1 glucosamine-6-phosphate deaminase [Aphanothece hegewaldii CCALA 016]